MAIQQLIEPQQNNLIDMFLQAEQIKSARSANALAEARAAELPYTREREAALNAQRIKASDALSGKYQAETDSTNAKIGLQVAEFVMRNPADEGPIIGALRHSAQAVPAMGQVADHLETLRGTPAFAETVGRMAMSVKQKADAQLNEQKFGESQRHNLAGESVAQAHLGVSQANAAETRRYHGAMENKPASGFSMGYDAEGRPIVNYGIKPEETAMGTERGKTRAKAQQDLPGVEDLSTATINQIDELIAHPGFESAVGATLLPYASRVPGTSESDFVNRLDQLKGGAFLQAFESLKGGGQITVIEGDKATQAINRMNTATSEREFIAAADAFKSVIVKARDRARNAAKQPPRVVIPYGAAPPAMEPGADPGVTPQEVEAEMRRRGLLQ